MIVRKVGALMATTVLAHDTQMHRPGSVDPGRLRPGRAGRPPTLATASALLLRAKRGGPARAFVFVHSERFAPAKGAAPFARRRESRVLYILPRAQHGPCVVQRLVRASPATCAGNGRDADVYPRGSGARSRIDCGGGPGGRRARTSRASRVASVEGGRHPGYGTANRIVPLADSYLELVTVADESEAVRSPFGSWVARVQCERGRPLGWAVRTHALDAVARRLGFTIRAGSRRAKRRSSALAASRPRARGSRAVASVLHRVGPGNAVPGARFGTTPGRRRSDRGAAARRRQRPRCRVAGGPAPPDHRPLGAAGGREHRPRGSGRRDRPRRRSAVNELELRAPCEQLQLPQQRSRPDPRRHPVGLSQRDARVAAGGDERLGLPPIAVRQDAPSAVGVHEAPHQRAVESSGIQSSPRRHGSGA